MLNEFGSYIDSLKCFQSSPLPKIRDGERRRHVIGLRINKNVIATCQMQCEQTMLLGRL
jgi:hypothetical protein